MSQKPLRQRIVIIVSFVSFFGSSVYGAVNLIKTSLNQPPENTAKAAESVPSTRELQDPQLQMQERDYELVLKQEPDNQIALKGLVEIRRQMNDSKGAIQPLEKLVKLNPENQEYKMLLAQIKNEDGKGERH